MVCKAKVVDSVIFIEAAEVQGLPVLSLTGDLDASSCREVREIVLALLAEERSYLVLDLSQVERMYAAGMSVLLELQRAALRRGGRLICCGARPFIREMLRITMLDQTLDLHADLESALDAAREAC